MKKLLGGLLASIMMAAGLVAFSGTSASAAQCERYGVCTEPDADVRADKRIPARERPRARMKMSSDGNAVPRGAIKILIRRAPVGESPSKAIRQRIKNTNENGAATLATKSLPRGRYQVVLKFIPDQNTPWKRVNRVYYLKVV